MTSPPPPHPRAMVAAAPVPLRTTRPQWRSTPGHLASHGRNRVGAPPVAIAAAASMGSGSSALGRRCRDRELVPATAATRGGGSSAPSHHRRRKHGLGGSSARGHRRHARAGELRPWPPPPPQAWARGGGGLRPRPPHAGRDLAPNRHCCHEREGEGGDRIQERAP
jgi:hypothetical protein